MSKNILPVCPQNKYTRLLESVQKRMNVNSSEEEKMPLRTNAVQELKYCLGSRPAFSRRDKLISTCAKRYTPKPRYPVTPAIPVQQPANNDTNIRLKLTTSELFFMLGSDSISLPSGLVEYF